MVLVDTSVWIAHFRDSDTELGSLLVHDSVVCHPFIIGELACGNLKNRSEILSLLRKLPQAILADAEEVMRFIERHSLMGKGLGYIDIHILASALLTDVPLWTLDKKLKEASTKMGIKF